VGSQSENMPADNLKRAMQRGTASCPEQFMRRSPSKAMVRGVALIVEVTTDNRNRTVSEVRHASQKTG